MLITDLGEFVKRQSEIQIHISITINEALFLKTSLLYLNLLYISLPYPTITLNYPTVS